MPADEIASTRYRDLPRAADGGRSAWHLFRDGESSLGLIALQTPERVAEAARLVRSGQMFSLNAPMDFISPPLFGRGSVRHSKIRRRGSMDDVWDNFYPQASSQWDSLAHVGYKPDVFFAGVTAADIMHDDRNSVQHWASRGIAGRGVLLDVYGEAEKRGRPFDPGSSYGISVAELDAARRSARVEIRPGDILLIRTGFMEWYGKQGPEVRARIAPRESFTAAGLEHSEAMAEYIWDCHVSAIASDAPSVEVWPPDGSPGAAPFGFLHRVLIGQFGLAMGELWLLEELAAACRADGSYEFLVVSAPLNIRGGIGSTANALAIK